MTTQRLTDGIQHKLLLKLLEFDYTIEYNKGKENVVADATRRDIQCHAATTCVPQWTDDAKLGYREDIDSFKLLKKIAVDIGEQPQYTLQRWVNQKW